MFFKTEKEKCFAYLAHTACDNNNFILDFHITPGNIHDSVAFSDLYKKIKNNSKQHTTAIAIDAGYITPYICKTILDDGIIPAIPYKRPMTKKGFFKKYEYVYDEYYDCYICPNNKILKYSTTNRDGYREYKSNPSDCKSCEHLNICTNSKNKQKLVTRHIWQNYLEEADHLRHKPYVKKVYSKRKETIERVFADAKEKHGMRYTKLRGLSKIKMEVSLIFSCMNLKKLANWMWKDTSNNLRFKPIFSILSLKIFIKKKIAILYKSKWLFCLQSNTTKFLVVFFIINIAKLHFHQNNYIFHLHTIHQLTYNYLYNGSNTIFLFPYTILFSKYHYYLHNTNLHNIVSIQFSFYHNH